MTHTLFILRRNGCAAPSSVSTPLSFDWRIISLPLWPRSEIAHYPNKFENASSILATEMN